MIAGATLSNNQGLTIAPAFSNAISAYTGTTLLSPLFVAIGNSFAANLTSGTLLGLETMAANVCPALADNTPSAYAPTIGNILGDPSFGNSSAGFTGVIASVGETYLGNGNTTVFAQVFTAANGYITQTNDFINTAYNSQTYLGSTFTTMNSLITGNLTDVNLALPEFGQDLANLGFLVNLANLGNFGLPSTVFRQLATVTNLTPRVTVALKQVGFTTVQIENITDSEAALTDTEEAKLYRAMQLVTGQGLQQVCNILRITLPVAGVNTTAQPQNPGLETMADLLNPVKIFPNSFASLTVRTYNQNTTSELRAIYTDSTGNVNSKLIEYLPRYVITVVPA